MRRSGPALLVVAAAGCAVAAASQPALRCAPRFMGPPVSARLGTRTKLVPGRPRSVWLCRYSGLNDGSPRFRLLASRLIADPRSTGRLARALDALPAPKGTTACPADFGTEVVAQFRYASGAADPVSVSLSGCPAASNGHVRADAFPVAAQVAALVPLSPRARIHGEVQVCGGPAPGRCYVETAGFCSPDCVSTDRVAALDASGRTAATAPIRRGRFALRLIGGRYTLRLLGDGPKRHGVVMQTRSLAAVPGRTSNVVFMFAVP